MPDTCLSLVSSSPVNNMLSISQSILLVMGNLLSFLNVKRSYLAHCLPFVRRDDKGGFKSSLYGYSAIFDLLGVL